jgi:hypothetical protein
MGVDTEEALTQHDEARNMKDGVGCELVKLHTVYREQSTKELVDWERERDHRKGIGKTFPGSPPNGG